MHKLHVSSAHPGEQYSSDVAPHLPVLVLGQAIKILRQVLKLEMGIEMHDKEECDRAAPRTEISGSRDDGETASSFPLQCPRNSLWLLLKLGAALRWYAQCTWRGPGQTGVIRPELDAIGTLDIFVPAMDCLKDQLMSCSPVGALG